MSIVKRRTNPVWLARQDLNDPTLNKHTRRSVRYYQKLYQAFPAWAENDPRFDQIEAEYQRRKARGEKVNKDHIVPLCSDLVCGLHCPDNLEVVTESYNQAKSNKWWPDGPFESRDLLGFLLTEFSAEQYELAL